MTDLPILRHAPIREALIDIQFSPEIAIGDVHKAAEPLAVRFPTSQKIRRGQLSVSFDGSKGPATSFVDNEEYAVRLETVDKQKVLQLRKDGFTFSLVGFYTNWDEFEAEAQSYWSEFTGKLDSRIVQRVATRFINVVALPPGSIDLDEYLPGGPRVPAGVPQAIGSFFSRVVIPFPDAGAIAIVTQAMEMATPDTTSVVLDIDAFSGVQLQGSDSTIWTKLRALRAVKNTIFSRYLTPKALEKYK